MMHPAAQTVENYYALINQKDWPGIAGMFDLPATLVIGPRKIVLDKPEAVVALYQRLGEKFVHEGAARLVWDRGSFTVIEVHDDLAVIKTVVTREGANRVPVKTWNCSYTVRLAGSAWRFTLVTSDDAGNERAV